MQFLLHISNVSSSNEQTSAPFCLFAFLLLVSSGTFNKNVFFSASPIIYLFLESQAMSKFTSLVLKLRQFYLHPIVSNEHFLAEEVLQI